jgi:hypothetical protein
MGVCKQLLVCATVLAPVNDRLCVQMFRHKGYVQANDGHVHCVLGPVDPDHDQGPRAYPLDSSKAADRLRVLRVSGVIRGSAWGSVRSYACDPSEPRLLDPLRSMAERSAGALR